jgi:hypothetical protein
MDRNLGMAGVSSQRRYGDYNDGQFSTLQMR